MTSAAIKLSRDQWLYCLRVGLAVSVAYLLAHGSDPSGGLYAILGAGLVQAANVGEGIGISRDRLIGTVLGVVIGIPVASAAGVSVWTIATACLLASIAGMAVGRAAVARIAITVAAVTVLLHVTDATHYGLFRLTNTAMGVTVAVAVSYLFWPVTGEAHLRRSAADALAAGAKLARALTSVDGDHTIRAPQRALFRALAALPKALSEAEQDPVGPQRRRALGDVAKIVAAIGTSLLAASTAIGDLGPADRQAPWWRDLCHGLTSAADRLERASVALRSRAPLVDALAEVSLLSREETVRLHSGPFSSESARLAVHGIMRDLAQVARRLDQLRRGATFAEEAP